MDVQERFTALVEHFAAHPGVQAPGDRRAFGSSALKVRGAIFAMLCDHTLVVKLPRQRVTELIASGVARPFGAGKGRPMKEWLTITDDDAWLPLAEEALQFVQGSRR